MLLMLVGGCADAFACTTSDWSFTTDPGGGNLRATGPLDGAAAIGFSGPCALEVSADGVHVAFVEDRTPTAEEGYNARFYLFAGAGLSMAGGGVVRIFEALDGTSSTVLAVTLGATGAAGSFDLSLTSGGMTTTDARISAGWHSVEVRWRQGAAAPVVLVVDGIAQATLVVDSHAQTIDTVRLGLVGGTLSAASGTFLVDAFASRRSEVVGELLACDANDDAEVNVVDLQAIVNEILSPAMDGAIGQPDCNRDGAVNVVDVAGTVNAILGR